MPDPISMLWYNTVFHCPMITTKPLFETRDAVAPASQKKCYELFPKAWPLKKLTTFAFGQFTTISGRFLPIA